MVERIREKESWDQRTMERIEDGKVERMGSKKRERVVSMKRGSFKNTQKTSLRTESLVQAEHAATGDAEDGNAAYGYVEN